MVNNTPIHQALDGRAVAPLNISTADVAAVVGYLEKVGVGLDSRIVGQMMTGIGLDSIQGLGATTAAITTPIQFLQAWLPDFIKVVTAPRLIDELIGVATVGDWETEEVVQGILEMTGTAQPYTDRGNVVMASSNFNAERRTVVRFESGLEVGQLEEARSAAMRVSLASEKRNAAALALEIRRNSVGFYGYNDGAGRTYGLLNDPNLPAYVSVPTYSGATLWSAKTYLQLVSDLRTIFEALRVKSKGLINPEGGDKITLALPVASIGYLGVVSDYGNSVRDWLAKTYPGVRVIAVPELDGANGGSNAGYLYAETFSAAGSGNTFLQAVPARVRALGVEKRIKSYAEASGNATAGVFCRYPVAVYRFTGF